MESNQQILSGEFKLPPAQTLPVAENPPLEQSTPTPSSSSLGSHFSQYPKNFSFQSKDATEQVVLVLKSHIITNIPWMTFAVILVLIPFALLFISGSFSIIKLDSLTKILILAVYYLIVFGYVFLNFALWYFQTAIITSKRVIDINLNGILSLQISEAPLESVLDIGYTQKGLIASFFDYGNITLETETRAQNLEISKAPHPAKVVDIMSKLVAAKGGHI